MAKILVVAELKEGRVKKVTHEILSKVNKDGAEAVAIALGAEDLSSATSDLYQMGAKKVITVTDGALKFYTNEAYSKAILAAVAQESPAGLILGASALGKDLAPALSGKLGSGLASDCVSITIKSDGKLEATRPIYSGKALAQIEVLGSSPFVATVRSNSMPADFKGTASGQAAPLSVSFSDLKTKIIDVTKGNAAKVDLTEANIIVSGGRALKSSDNFAILEKLSEVIPGSAVGASRAAVDAGYRPHSYQVGQTGKVVSPSLYLAFGISGAIQHLAGMRTSKVIVAINKDPEAPIFQIADYGLVADLFEVAPLLTEELKHFYSQA